MIDYLKKYLKEEELEEGLKKLKEGMAPQYIIGNVDFYGYNFDIDKRVLIPRFETEQLVEKTIKYIKSHFDNPKILDIGTGSGCIAITLSKELNVNVDAIDISNDALEVAKHNNKKLNGKVTFKQSDILKSVEDTYDVIISNPPYIKMGEQIEKIVKENEPSIALYAKEDGLYFYREILKNAKKHLNKKSLIAFEIGQTQANQIKDIATSYFKDCKIKIEKDYAGLDRFVFIFINLG